MTHFPVSSSNLSAPHLALFLQEEYELGKDLRCRIIRAGVNHTYMVDGETGKYVFRVYSLGWRSRTEIAEEIRLLNMLRENNISVSYPIADKNNNYIRTLGAPEGDRFGVLFSYAPGDKLHNYDPETHFSAGKLMADFHKVTVNEHLDRITYTPETLLVDSMEQLTKFVSADTEEMDFMRSTLRYLLHQLENADQAQLRKGIVHMDMWFDNMNIAKDSTITLFDFDFTGNGWLCLDIAYYLMQLYVVEPVPQELSSKSEAFLEGYESVTALSDEEKRLLPILGVCLMIFYLGVQCRRFDDYSSIFLSETYLKRYISQRIKKFFDFHAPGW